MLGLWLEGGKRHAKNVKNHLSKTKIHEYITYSKYTVHIFKHNIHQVHSTYFQECFWSFMAFWLLEKSCWLSFGLWGPTRKTDYSAPGWGVSFFQSWFEYKFWLQNKETIKKIESSCQIQNFGRNFKSKKVVSCGFRGLWIHIFIKVDFNFVF